MAQDCETGAPQRARETALSAASHLPLSNFSSPWPVQGVPGGGLCEEGRGWPQAGHLSRQTPGPGPACGHWGAPCSSVLPGSGTPGVKPALEPEV